MIKKAKKKNPEAWVPDDHGIVQPFWTLCLPPVFPHAREIYLCLVKDTVMLHLLMNNILINNLVSRAPGGQSPGI